MTTVRKVANTFAGLAAAAVAGLVIYKAVTDYSKVKKAFEDFRASVPQLGEKEAVLAAKAQHIKVPSPGTTIGLTALKLYGIGFAYTLVHAAIEVHSFRQEFMRD